jgi:hypothetical protein
VPILRDLPLQSGSQFHGPIGTLSTFDDDMTHCFGMNEAEGKPTSGIGTSRHFAAPQNLIAIRA